MVTNLQKAFSGANYLYYTYSHFPDPNNPGYKCADTFRDYLDDDVRELSAQINIALYNRNITEINLIGHSMGGLIGFTYAAAVVEHVGFIYNLPKKFYQSSHF